MSQKFFPKSREVSLQYIKSILVELYFNNKNSSDEITSLVSKKPDDTITGFLGVTAKRFQFKEEEIIAAHCNHLMATEYGRLSMVPMQLLQHLLSGPQDLSFADGSVKSTRMLWERLGGETSYTNSIYYKIPLRPLSFASRPVRKNLAPLVNRSLKAISGGIDFIGNHLRIPFFYRKKPKLHLIELKPSLLLEGLQNVSRHFEIFPAYDLDDLDRLMQLIEMEKRYGALQKAGVINHEGKLLGWFIYYAKTGDVCEVIQAVSLPGYEDELYNMLAWHAYQKGGIELSGRIMAGQFGSAITGRSFTMPGRMWTLLHSRNPRLRYSIQSGNAFLTRLEGDLWLL